MHRRNFGKQASGPPATLPPGSRRATSLPCPVGPGAEAARSWPCGGTLPFPRAIAGRGRPPASAGVPVLELRK